MTAKYLEGDQFVAFLVATGLDRYAETEGGLGLRMYHDLGFYGDVAWSYIETLSDDFGIDTSHFSFGLYFPPEYLQGGWVLSNFAAFAPFIRKNLDFNLPYREFPLSKFERAIVSGFLI